MRIGPLEIRKRVALAEAQPARTPHPEIGASGTVSLNGFLQQDEYNSDLRGLNGIRKFRRMLDSDASVQEALEHLFSPIRNATWNVEPPDNPDDDELLATAIGKAALFDWLDQSWIEYLDMALEYLPYGHAVFELPTVVVEKELQVAVPGEFDVGPNGQRVEKTKLLPSAQYLTVERFAPRLQETIWRWYMENGKLDRIVQQAFKNNAWGNWEIPAEQLLVLTHKRRGDNLMGRSILRSAHKAWTFKELIERISVVAMDRHGVGVPIAYPPEDRKDDDATLDRLEDMLQNLRAGAYTYIVAPGPKAQGQTPGYTFEIMSLQGGFPDFTSLLEYNRAEIKAAVLARFAELGHGKVGARATGDIQSIVWFAALSAIGKYLCEAHQPVLERIIDANVKVSRYPKLTVTGIEIRNLVEFAAANAQLVAAGAVNPDTSYRRYIRDEIGAPEEDEPDENQTDPNAPPAPDPNGPGLPPKPPAETPPGYQGKIENE